MTQQKMDKTEPYAVIEGAGTNQWRVEIWTDRYKYFETHRKHFYRRASAERWARKMLAKEKARSEHERERTVITL